MHKRSWNAGIFLGDLFVKNIHQQPAPEILYNYLTKQLPGASYQCVYESGLFVYWIQRQLSELGITCLVVNPADIPSSHQDEVYKTDSRDSRGIGQALAKGQLRGIYIPPLLQEADRNLIREVELLRKELLAISTDIRKLMRSADYKKLYYLVRSVTGIGPLTAAKSGSRNPGTDQLLSSQEPNQATTGHFTRGALPETR